MHHQHFLKCDKLYVRTKLDLVNERKFASEMEMIMRTRRYQFLEVCIDQLKWTLQWFQVKHFSSRRKV